MLSRTAENLFWIARYMERAETTARLLEVGAHNALLPNTGGGFRNEWESILRASGTAGAFAAKYGDPVQRNVESHMFFDTDNPSSIASCIRAARENARIVRTALTSQVWDALNMTYQELKELSRTERSKLQLRDLTDWTVRAAALVRGAIAASQLRNDGYRFLFLGYALERADATARLLDVKYYVLLPAVSYVGSGLDNYQWTTLLRALSSDRAFNWAYGGDVTATKIAEFLILNAQCPRSLITCTGSALEQLNALAVEYGRTTPAVTLAEDLHGELKRARIEEVFDEGLHEFLSRFIDSTASLAGAIHQSYLTGRQQ